MISAGNESARFARIADGQKVKEIETLQGIARTGMVHFGWMLADLAACIGFLIWVHGAQRNLPALGASGLEFSPLSAVIWFFVPVANAVVPAFVLNELWVKTGRRVRHRDPLRDDRSGCRGDDARRARTRRARRSRWARGNAHLPRVLRGRTPRPFRDQHLDRLDGRGATGGSESGVARERAALTLSASENRHSS